MSLSFGERRLSYRQRYTCFFIFFIYFYLFIFFNFFCSRYVQLPRPPTTLQSSPNLPGRWQIGCKLAANPAIEKLSFWFLNSLGSGSNGS